MLTQLRGKLDRRWRRFIKLVVLGAPRELLNNELDLICPVVEQIAEEYGRDRWLAELTGGDLSFEECEMLFGLVPDDWPESEETEQEPSAEEDRK